MQETIGERLRRLRQERGWTQNVLGYHAGRAPSVISQVETGKREPELSTVKALGRALGVDWRYLLLGDETPKVDRPPLDKLLEEAGVETRWLLGPKSDLLAVLGDRIATFGGPPANQDDRAIIDVAWAALAEYKELKPRIHSGPINPDGRRAIAAEYVNDWLQIMVRAVQIHQALTDIVADDSAPEDARDDARAWLEFFKGLDDDELDRITCEMGQEFPKTSHA